MKGWRDKAEFKNAVNDYGSRIGVEIQSISIRPMRNKWASCSTKGNLNFNEELLDIDKKLGKYVIVHELVHFHVPNHGRLWKALMMAYVGDYEKIEKKLKKMSALSTSPKRKLDISGKSRKRQ